MRAAHLQFYLPVNTRNRGIFFEYVRQGRLSRYGHALWNLYSRRIELTTYEEVSCQSQRILAPEAFNGNSCSR